MKTILIITAVLFPAIAAGAELRFACPKHYLTQVTELPEVPLAWPGAVATVRPGLLISGGGVVGGPAKLYPPAELAGADIKTGRGWREARYPLGPDDESWAYCAYGQGGEIQLFRRVDGQGRRECTVRQSQRKPTDSLQVEIVCK
jgi:hypothetical protein